MNFALYLVLFSLLGFAQSAIWPMTVAIMGMTNKKEVRGSIVGVWSVNSAVGDLLGYFLSALLMSVGFDWVFVSFCTLVVFCVVVTCNFWLLPDHISPTETKPRISVLAALQLPTVFYYCACYACVKLIHLSIMIWVPYFMYDSLGMDTKIGGIIMMLYSFGGILGGIFSGVISDKVPDRSYVLLGMTMASVPMINLFSFQLGKSDWLSCLFMIIVGFLVSGGSNFLSAVIAADMCDLETETEAKSTLTGLVDASGGIGASFGQMLVFFI
jgi:sugar phosphate permease